MGTKRMSDEEIHTQVDTFSKFLDEAGYSSAVIVTTKTPNDNKEGETQQCAVLNANNVKGDVIVTLLSGMDMLKDQIMKDTLPPQMKGLMDILKGLGASNDLRN